MEKYAEIDPRYTPDHSPVPQPKQANETRATPAELERLANSPDQRLAKQAERDSQR